MKLAVVCPYSLSVPGGVQQQVLGIVTRLRDEGWDAVAVGPEAGAEPGRVDIGRSHTLQINRSNAPIALSPAGWRRVREAVADADVVHIHEPMVPLVGWSAVNARRPTLLTFHADPSRLVREIYAVGGKQIGGWLRGATATAVSKIAATAVTPLGLPITTIPNGVHIDSFRRDVPRDPLRVVFVGRPDPRKGRDLLLEAWPKVRQASPRARLMVVGGGDTPSIEGVEYRGRVTEDKKQAILAAGGVFCAPNRGGESFGITVVEGMAAGCAVVASDLPAFRAVLDGTGLLFRNGDPDSLAEQLLAVLGDPSLRDRLARASSERAREFDWKAVMPRYIELYRALL